MPSEPGVPYIRESSGGRVSNANLIDLMRLVLVDGKKPFRFTAYGFSMSPLIRIGDAVTIAPRAGNIPRVGDVIAFICPKDGKLTIHRVVKKQAAGFLMLGDNADSPDGIIPTACILGRVISVKRNGKTLSAGLGCERSVIAFLSRNHLLKPVLSIARYPFRIGSAGKRKFLAAAQYSHDHC